MQTKHTTNHYPAIICFLFFVLVYISCSKPDRSLTPINTVAQKDNYFNVPSGTNAYVTVIANILERQNEKKNFKDALIKNAGYAKWKFAKAKSGNASSRETGEELINIPFVKEGQLGVSAILTARITLTDTSYQLLYPQHYVYYEMGDSTSLRSAADFFTVFSNFDYDMFGITEYNVVDGRIFGYDKDDTLHVTVIHDGDRPGERHVTNVNTQNASFITQCNTIKACVTAGSPTKRVSSAQSRENCTTTTNCTTIWVGDTGAGNASGSQSGNNGLPGGGGSGAPTGGNGGKPNQITNPPCKPAMVGNQRVEADPCEETPWVPKVDKVDCNTFSFTKTSTANWQEAGVNNISLKWIWYDGDNDGTSRELTINHIVFGLPMRYSDGTIQSAGQAATKAAKILENVKLLTKLEFTSSPYSPTDNAVITYFKAQLQLAMRVEGGTSGVTGSGSLNIIFRDEEQSYITDPYDCY